MLIDGSSMRTVGMERGAMVDKRLFSLVPGVRGLVVGKIICLWVGLVSDIALAGTVAVLVAALFPQTTVRVALQSIGIAGPSGFMLIGVAALAIAVVRFLAHHFVLNAVVFPTGVCCSRKIPARLAAGFMIIDRSSMWTVGMERGAMVDKRLFSLVPGVRGLVVGKIICLWIGLVADIALAGTVTVLVASLFPQTSVHSALQSIGISGPAGFMLIAIATLAIAAVRFLAHHFATRLGTETAERVKLGLRSGLYRKMLRLGPSYAQRTRTADVVQLTGEGVDQIALQSIGISGPAGFMLIAIATLAIAAVRFLAHHFATRLGTETAERVKLGLRSGLYRKMLRLGPSYAQRTRTADVVQLTGEGVDQIQSFFELFLPQLGFAILAPLTLFAAIAPLNIPTAVVLLVCAPLIIVIVGAIAMTTAKTFKKYWGARFRDPRAAHTVCGDRPAQHTHRCGAARLRAAHHRDRRRHRHDHGEDVQKVLG